MLDELDEPKPPSEPEPPDEKPPDDAWDEAWAEPDEPSEMQWTPRLIFFGDQVCFEWFLKNLISHFLKILSLCP